MKKVTLYTYGLKNVRVVDGDTLECDIDLGFGVALTKCKVRVAHVNAPEKDTPEGIAAKEYTAKIVATSKSIVVTVKNHAKDKYGRILGDIFCDDSDLAQFLIANNHGVAYEGGAR